MKQRKQKLVNKGFQLNMAFKISAFSFTAFIVLILVLGMISSRNSREIIENMTELEKAVTVEKDIVKAFTEYGRRLRGHGISLYTDKIVTDHQKSMETVDGFVELTKKIAGQNSIALRAIMIIGLIQIIALFIFMIRLTHRISGPEHLLERHLDEMLDGKDPVFRPLRKGDELAGIYDRVQRLNDLMKNMRQKK